MTPSGQKIVYVTREIERALGTAPNDGYIIVSNATAYGKTVQKQYPDSVILVDAPDGELLGTTDLLLHPTVSAMVNSLDATSTGLLVFKNTARVESAAKTLNRKLLNPPSVLSERVENKISQIRWLGQIGDRYLPSHAVKVCKTITWKNDPFILQWAHGHTGDGTMLIRDRDDLNAVQQKFPERIARISGFVTGPSLTVNIVVTPERILMGNVSYQITGMAPFTENDLSTVGNDWGLARQILSASEKASFESMAAEIGRKLQTEGWRGLFGIDVIKDVARDRIHLIEVNARQPASATFESHLQEIERAKGARGLTTFEAHLRALSGLPIDQNLIEITDGAQIIQRVTKNVQSMFDDAAGSLEKAGYKVVAYQNTAPNSDLLRIQSPESIMESHKAFNAKGKEILNLIKSSQFKINI